MNLPAKNLSARQWGHDRIPWSGHPNEWVEQTPATYLRLKRVTDIFFSVLILLFIGSWLLPLLCLLVKLESKGSPLFSQKRTGEQGRTFTCYKLRTMRVNGEADTRQATDYDERITRLGKFLRLSSLDELPQFFNVLKGDMSLVGPRPHMLFHTRKYGNLIPHYHKRHLVKPGITGLAQVKGYRGPTEKLIDMEKRVQADLYYISKRSMAFDLMILWRTFREITKALRMT